MNTLTENINQTISEAINEFAEVLSKEFSIDKDKIIELWNKDSPVIKSSSQNSGNTNKTVSKRKSTSDDKKCEHVKTRGPPGTCGQKVSPESKTGKYCKRHLSNEEKSETTDSNTVKESTKTSATKKETVKKPNTTSSVKKEVKEQELPAVKAVQQNLPVVKIKLNKWKKYEHSETGFLFDRKSNEVYGIQNADGTEGALTQENIETCKRLGLAYRLPENLANDDNDDSEEKEDDLEPEEEDEIPDEDD